MTMSYPHVGIILFHFIPQGNLFFVFPGKLVFKCRLWSRENIIVEEIFEQLFQLTAQSSTLFIIVKYHRKLEKGRIL